MACIHFFWRSVENVKSRGISSPTKLVRHYAAHCAFEFGYGNSTGTSVLSFFFSVLAHWWIDGKRIELVKKWYPKRLADEAKLTPEAWYHQNKNLQLYGARAVA